MQVLGLAKKMKMIQEQVEREQREAKARIPKAQLLPYTTDYPIVSVVYFTPCPVKVWCRQYLLVPCFEVQKNSHMYRLGMVLGFRICIYICNDEENLTLEGIRFVTDCVLLVWKLDDSDPTQARAKGVYKARTVPPREHCETWRGAATHGWRACKIRGNGSIP